MHTHTGMLGTFVLGQEALTHHIKTFLSVETLLMLSMTTKELRKFVDQECYKCFTSVIYQKKLIVHYPSALFKKQESDPDSQTTVFKGVIDVSHRREKFKTMDLFHVCWEEMCIPMYMSIRSDNATYMFSMFQIQKIYMPEQRVTASQNRWGTRRYTLHLVSTQTRMNKNGQHIASNAKLELKVENADIRYKLCPRAYYASMVYKLRSTCGICKRDWMFFMTYDKKAEVKHRGICKRCRSEFFVSFADLKNRYGLKFCTKQAGANVQQFQIGYVGNYGYGSTETLVILKEDIAKLTGFGSWKEMIEKWSKKKLDPGLVDISF